MRTHVLTTLFFFSSLTACSTTVSVVAGKTGLADAAGSTSTSTGSPAATPTTPTILVALPDTEAAETVLAGLQRELGEDFRFVRFYVGPTESAATLGAAVEQSRPAAVVLMNNSTVRLFRDWKAGRGAQPTPPGVVALASFADEAVAGDQDLTGVAYEVPIVTQLIQLRSLSPKPVTKVGIVHRPGLRGYVEKQRALAEREKFKVESAETSDWATPREIRASVKALRERGIEAVVVLNDNGLLRMDLISDGWVPAFELARLPVLVGVRGLVNPKVDFGTMGLLPDHEAMGVQVANLLLELKDADWKIGGRAVDLPLAVKTVIHARGAARVAEIPREALVRADEVVE